MVCQGSQSITIPEHIVAKQIDVTAFVHANFSADIKFSSPTDLQLDNLKIFFMKQKYLMDFMIKLAFILRLLAKK
jgi:hypothetical protein